MLISFRSQLFYWSGFIAIAIVAYYAGMWLAESRRTSAQEEFYKRREVLTESYLSSRGLKVGDSIPGVELEDLEFNNIAIDTLLVDKAILVFIDPTCYSCEEELALLSSLPKRAILRDRLIIVSAGNPRHLMDIRRAYDVKYKILYDHNRVFSDMLNVDSYPFNLFVTANRKIERAAMGAITEEEIDTFFFSQQSE